MTNKRKMLPEYREKLAVKSKDVFRWTIGENAITEMTKKIREKEPSFLNCFTKYKAYSDYTRPQSETDNTVQPTCLTIKRECGESAADMCKRNLEVEGHCEIGTKTAAEVRDEKCCR